MSSFGPMTPQIGNANQILGQPTALNQVGPSSASYNPALMGMPGQANPTQNLPQAPQMQSMGAQGPVSQPMPQAPQPQVQPPPTVGMPPGPSETEMILKALISRLGVHSKHEEAVRNTLMPPQPQGA